MRMTTFYVLSMLMVLSLNPGVKAYCKTNGCSAWSIVPYKHFFRRACDKHDVCYACGVYNGWSRKRCDKTFRYDMFKLCRSSMVKWWCKSWAWAYFGAVRFFGKSRYEKPSLTWCKTCPKRRGDPWKILK